MSTKQISNATETILNLIDRDDADLAVWAIDWLSIDLASAWPDLDANQKDWLDENGVVGTVKATVE